MGKIEKLELEVKSLSPAELAAFRAWYEEFDAENWDKQIEADALAGKLDKRVAQAIADYKGGKAKSI